LKSNFSYETRLHKKGFALIIGVDEAGRGPLAGPVVACAVFLQQKDFDNQIEDSKRLTVVSREKAFFEIKQKSQFGIGIVNHRDIDRENILNATLKAMQKAVSRLSVKLSDSQRASAFVIVDGNMRLKFPLPSRSIVKGDLKSKSIAAASILAKVTRDRIMEKFDKIYPGYGFSKHKGYPTLEHRQLIRKKGPSLIHRKSFLKCVQ
jgi:ribonuclease HII